VRIQHLEQAALLMILTGTIMGYAYASGASPVGTAAISFERQFAYWRSFGPASAGFWAMVFCNVIAPWASSSELHRLAPLWVISLLVLIGMWIERAVIIIRSLGHDFMPENWSGYHPTWVEVSIGLASLSWFLFWFMLYAKFIPTVSIAESKEPRIEDSTEWVE
jgi:molybdopterin-containing oxidoreductase family membrane subunit